MSGTPTGNLPTTSRDAGAAPAAQPDWSQRPLTRDGFIELVWREGAKHYRELPWRNIDDPYAVLVSEVMLQQTQVARVQRYWPRWLEWFPTIGALAAAETAQVLEAWQGLGYNRRALALKRACQQVVLEFDGALPRSVGQLQKLPGIGPATAAGVVAFAHDLPAVYIETNVRSVVLHELFPGEQGITDRQIAPFVADTCPDGNVRGWYYALLDYGTALKAHGTNPSRRSSHYARQSPFEGSKREKRSFIVRLVLASSQGIACAQARQALDAHEIAQGRAVVDPALFERIVAELVAEGFFAMVGPDRILVP